MSKAKWTPGPWEVELIVGLPRIISDSRKATCRVIGDLHIQEGVGALKGNTVLRDEIAANARLIAAAPELYAALEMAQRAITTLVRALPHPQHSDDLYIPQLDEAESADLAATAALAKARGESQTRKPGVEKPAQPAATSEPFFSYPDEE